MTQDVSDKIKQQAALAAIAFLERATPLITFKKLVRVSQEDIQSFIKLTNRPLPPDFQYWLTTYGSGRIEFLSGSIRIPSLNDLWSYASDGPRLIFEDAPADCRNRIAISYSGAPSHNALDLTIQDEHGCTPVIETYSYSDRVQCVLASSWMMYIIKNVITSANITLGESEFRKQSQVWNAAEAIGSEFFPAIDKDLENAHIRAMKHNYTRYSETPANPNFIRVMLDSALSGRPRKTKGNKIKDAFVNDGTIDNRYTKFASYAEPKVPNKLDDAVKLIEKQIQQGNTELSYEAIKFIEDSTRKKDAQELYKLAEHPLRDIRQSAIAAICRIKAKNLKKLELLYKRTHDREVLSLIRDESRKKVRSKKQSEEWVKYFEEIASS